MAKATVGGMSAKRKGIVGDGERDALLARYEHMEEPALTDTKFTARGERPAHGRHIAGGTKFSGKSERSARKGREDEKDEDLSRPFYND